jgi:hypothetical protein
MNRILFCYYGRRQLGSIDVFSMSNAFLGFVVEKDTTDEATRGRAPREEYGSIIHGCDIIKGSWQLLPQSINYSPFWYQKYLRTEVLQYFEGLQQ